MFIRMYNFFFLICVFILLEQHGPRYITTAACREHVYPQLTTKLQPFLPEAVAGSTMLVWEVHVVLCLAAFMGSCDRSPDHTTWSTSLPLLLAVCDRILRAQDSLEPIGNS